ncbi:MAG: SoxR reducing system RseC family protein, partial [Desulfohalobiaceae bacterium]|nr:SoxR reducing system RseC family protein [Desulfohalobiaceae bacterium]
MAHDVASETGEVIHLLPGHRAKVKIPMGYSCESCGNRDLCEPFGRDYMVVEATNSIRARPGQVVQVSFTAEKPAKALLLLYLLPLATLILGAALGHQLAFFGARNLSSAILSLLFVTLTFVGLRYFTRRRYAANPETQPRVSKILD